jgi:hypothetical protein
MNKYKIFVQSESSFLCTEAIPSSLHTIMEKPIKHFVSFLNRTEIPVAIWDELLQTNFYVTELFCHRIFMLLLFTE